jgi:hypothetical protein
MTLQRVEWVLVVRYEISPHKAIYGRLPAPSNTTYSKDYIQLPRRQSFISALQSAFPKLASGDPSIPITYQWYGGSAAGKIFMKSADRPHLTWETDDAPAAWRMHPKASAARAETIRGNPNHKDAASANNEFNNLALSGFGQPYLIAVKLDGEPDIVHLRVQIEDPGAGFEWADISNSPSIVRDLAASTKPRKIVQCRYLSSKEASDALYFDPTEKGQPWADAPKTKSSSAGGTAVTAGAPYATYEALDSDLLAETSETSEEEVAEFEQQVSQGNYGVEDTRTTTKTRGSAQRVFAHAVKENYGCRCAITGIQTREFLIASHIVPWSVDESIRLDPSNGICLSVLVDRAFENGYLIINDDLTVSIDWAKVGSDSSLSDQLKPFDGRKLELPTASPPSTDYLRRRREM